MITRLTFPSRRTFADDKPLLLRPRFAVDLRAKIGARRVAAEFMPPHRIAQDVLTVRCSVDGVQFELARDENALIPIVVHLEKTLDGAREAMRVLPSFARAMLVFDHRARCGVPEAVALVGLMNWLSYRMVDEGMTETNRAIFAADRAMEDVFGATAQWLEDGYD